MSQETVFKYGLGVFAKVDSSVFDTSCSARTVVSCEDSKVQVMTLEEGKGRVDATKFKDFKFALNTGAVIIIPDNCEVSHPVFIESDSLNAKSEKIYVHVGKNSKVVFIDRSLSKELLAQQIVVDVQEGASALFGSVTKSDEESYVFSHKVAHVKKDATFYWFSLYKDGKFTQGDTSIVLEGEGAVGNTIALYTSQEKSVFDLNGESIHAASHTSSDMKAKGVLDGKCKAIFRGLVNVQEGKVECNGYQQEDTLLLSKEAEADLIPNLEISNNDVRCSHGATVSNLNEEQLFYLQSRGVSYGDAKKMIVDGFLASLLDEVASAELVELAKKVLSDE